jgi:hypothetical protein
MMVGTDVEIRKDRWWVGDQLFGRAHISALHPLYDRLHMRQQIAVAVYLTSSLSK